MTGEPSERTRATLILTLAWTSVAVAGWLVPASVHIVGWEGDTPHRIALLPSPTWLALFVALAAGAAVTVGRVLPPATERRVARVCAPLTLLLLWGVPYLPALAGWAPMLLVLAGPLRWAVAAVAIAGCVIAAAEEGLFPRVIWFRRLPGPRGAFLASLVIFLGLTFHVRSVQSLGGDEPHYLVITHSLVADGDLRIENNHTDNDYRSFHPGFIAPHYLARGVDNEIYSVHAPGLPVLLVPAYLLGGHWGAMVFMVVLASLGAAAIFALADRLTTRKVAWATWAAVTLTVPYALQSWMIYPDMPAAVITAFAVLWLWAPLPQRRLPWLLRGLAIGLLPWLHVKYSLLLAGLTLSLLVRVRRRWRLGVTMLAPMAASGLLWLTTYYVIYGTPDPTAPYGGIRDFDLSYIPRGILGLLFDQEFGLLLHSPIYVLAALGGWLMLRRAPTRWPTIGLLLTLAVFVGSVTQYYMWWGGYSVPARFLVPTLPLLAPMVAVALSRMTGPGGLGVSAALMAASLVTLGVVVYDPAAQLMFNNRDGTSVLVEALQGGVELTAALPSFLDLAWVGQIPRVLLWLGPFGLACLTVAAAGRYGRRSMTPFWAGVLYVSVFGTTATVLSASVPAVPSGLVGNHGALTRAGQQELLRAYDPDRLGAYLVGRTSRLTETQVMERATLTWPARESPELKPGEIAGPFSLSPGRYEVSVWFRSGTTGERRMWLRYGNGPGFIAEQTSRGSGPVVIAIDLPVGLDSVWVGAFDVQTAEAAETVLVRPRSITPKPKRVQAPNMTAVRTIEGEPGRYLFFLDQQAYREPTRWWIRGDRTTSILVSPNGARRMTVDVRRGRRGGSTAITIADWVQEFDLDARERREISFDLRGTEILVPLTVGCTGGYRPTDLDSDSTDQRYLGCQVSIRLN